MVRRNWCEAASHNRTLWSVLADNSVLPSGLNATLLIHAVCPVSVVIGLPLFASHRYTALFAPEANTALSGLKATHNNSSLFPLADPNGRWVATSHNRTLLSTLEDASHFPSGLNATPNTRPVCPVKTPIGLPVPASHRRIKLSSPPDASSLPSGLTATLWA